MFSVVTWEGWRYPQNPSRPFYKTRGTVERTLFHKRLATYCNEHDCASGITGLCKMIGIPYQTMQTRLRNPRGLRIYEFDAIADGLQLNNEEQLDLLTAIRNG